MSRHPRLRVRPMMPGDFAFVRELAAKQANFTIPPPYVLWILLRVNPEGCLLAEHQKLGPVGYLLSVPIRKPRQSLFAWQMAASREGARAGATDELFVALRSLAMSLGSRTIYFSAIPGTGSYRAISRQVMRVFGSRPEKTNALPPIVAPSECEFRIDLKPRRTPRVSSKISG